MADSKYSLTAFFPAYNDEHTIENIVRTAGEELGKITRDFEVLVVNDGSRDRTREILERLRLELPYLRVIHHEFNRGYGAALITGFQNATKDLIFYTDGDGQYDVREMHNLMAKFAPHIDWVNGYKVRRADPWHRVAIGEIYRRAMRMAFDLSVRDVDCDFRLFRRRILDTVTLESRSGIICVEMARKFDQAGFVVAEVPVSHYPRLHGSSEFFRIRHLTHTFRGLLQIWWELVLSRTVFPWIGIEAKKYRS
jgi:glycosyltransferase involved in cell wall biosynthesis